MNTNRVVIGVLAVVVIGFGGWLALSQEREADDDSMVKENAEEVMDKNEGSTMDKNADGSMMKKEEGAMMERGTYESYAPEKVTAAGDKKVLLFFYASWCPTCRPLDADIIARTGDIPANLLILKVNYDTETALKQKYGVTYQHTIVEVDSKGTVIKKWSASPTLAALLVEVK